MVFNFEHHCWQILDGTFAELDFHQMADAGVRQCTAEHGMQTAGSFCNAERVGEPHKRDNWSVAAFAGVR